MVERWLRNEVLPFVDLPRSQRAASVGVGAVVQAEVLGSFPGLPHHLCSPPFILWTSLISCRHQPPEGSGEIERSDLPQLVFPVRKKRRLIDPPPGLLVDRKSTRLNSSH